MILADIWISPTGKRYLMMENDSDPSGSSIFFYDLDGVQLKYDPTPFLRVPFQDWPDKVTISVAQSLRAYTIEDGEYYRIIPHLRFWNFHKADEQNKLCNFVQTAPKFLVYHPDTPQPPLRLAYPLHQRSYFCPECRAQRELTGQSALSQVCEHPQK